MITQLRGPIAQPTHLVHLTTVPIFDAETFSTNQIRCKKEEGTIKISVKESETQSVRPLSLLSQFLYCAVVSILLYWDQFSVLLKCAVIGFLSEALLHSANSLLIYCAVIGAIGLPACTQCSVWTELAPSRLTCTHEEGLEEKPTSWFSRGTALN